MTLAAGNAALFGFTVLTDFKLTAPRDGKDTLSLTLCDGPGAGARRVDVRFDVSRLSRRDIGGGFTPLLLLDIKDIRDRQLDRIAFAMPSASAALGRSSALRPY